MRSARWSNARWRNDGALPALEARAGRRGGLWSEIFAGDFAGQPALFLDRDGVIVEDTQYLGHAQDVRVRAGAADATARCNKRGIPVIVVRLSAGVVGNAL